ncbi:MAG: hypothetical protein JWM16_1298 [Verrucomicrobiales bacterium]|nr:hypothetical protein [Verrucomicrobiales bacterium]
MKYKILTLFLLLATLSAAPAAEQKPLTVAILDFEALFLLIAF